MQTTRLLIKGKVQGVFYRVAAKDVAYDIGITGWVRNTDTGDVEVLVSGTAAQIEKFINWCRKGPKKAVVTEVVIAEENKETFIGFLIIR